MGAILLLADWSLSDKSGASTTQLAVFDIAGVSLVAFLVWLTSYASGGLGVSIRKDGVVYFAHGPGRKFVWARYTLWPHLGTAKMAGPWGTDVVFATDDDPLSTSGDLAIAILSSPHYRHFGELSAETVRRLGLRHPAHPQVTE